MRPPTHDEVMAAIGYPDQHHEMQEEEMKGAEGSKLAPLLSTASTAAGDDDGPHFFPPMVDPLGGMALPSTTAQMQQWHHHDRHHDRHQLQRSYDEDDPLRGMGLPSASKRTTVAIGDGCNGATNETFSSTSPPHFPPPPPPPLPILPSANRINFSPRRQRLQHHQHQQQQNHGHHQIQRRERSRSPPSSGRRRPPQPVLPARDNERFDNEGGGGEDCDNGDDKSGNAERGHGGEGGGGGRLSSHPISREEGKILRRCANKDSGSASRVNTATDATGTIIGITTNPNETIHCHHVSVKGPFSNRGGGELSSSSSSSSSNNHNLSPPLHPTSLTAPHHHPSSFPSSRPTMGWQQQHAQAQAQAQPRASSVVAASASSVANGSGAPREPPPTNSDNITRQEAANRTSSSSLSSSSSSPPSCKHKQMALVRSEGGGKGGRKCNPGAVAVAPPAPPAPPIRGETAASSAGEFQLVTKENSGNPYVGDETRARILAELAGDALSECGATKVLSRYLQKRLKLLFPGGGGGRIGVGGRGGAARSYYSYYYASDPVIPQGEDVQKILVTNWIEELLRFLAIKSVTGDIKFPFEMGASAPIDAAWRGLMVMPAAYSKVCRIIMGGGGGGGGGGGPWSRNGTSSFNGNSVVIIDYDPFWQEDEIDFARVKKRVDCTLRMYQQCFGHSAPHLYWPGPQERGGGGVGGGGCVGAAAGRGGDAARNAFGMLAGSAEFALDRTLSMIHKACGPNGMF